MERIYNLFDKPIGYLVIICIVLTIYCTFLNFKKVRKPRGFIELSENYQKSSMYFCVIIMFLMVMIFTLLYLFGMKDVSGKEFDGHIIFISLALFYECFIFLYYNNKKIIFNEMEIKVYNFFMRENVYYWKDIINVKNKKNEVLVIDTVKGKFKIRYSLENIDKFFKILVERNLVQEDLSNFGKGKIMISIWKGVKYK